MKITNSTKIRNCQKKKLCMSHSNFKGTFCVTNLRVNIFVFFLSLVQCHCGLNLLGVHHLTFSEPQARIFYPHKRKSDFFLVLVEDCRVRLLFILCIFQTKIFLYYKIWRRKNKININMYILLKLLFPYWCFIYRYFQQCSALSRLPVTAN